MRIPGRRAGGPRRAVTGRAIVLGTVVVLLLVLLASPVNRYFSSRNDVDKAAVQLQQDRQKLAQLKQQNTLWADPGYIQQQAREKLQYALPGDTVYVVTGAGEHSDIDKTATDPSAQANGGSWNARLWTSVQRASH